MIIDWLVVILYLVAVLIVGLVYSNDIASSKDYTTFSFKDMRYSNLVLVATIFATAIGGGSTFGSGAKIFEGKHTYACAYFLAIIIKIIVAPKIIPKLQKFYKATSSADIMESLYGEPGQLITGIAASLASIGYVAAQISACGYIFEYFLKIPHLYGVIIAYGIVTIYTATGGLRSVIYTDVLQYIVMISGIPIIVFVTVNKIGGFTQFYYKIPHSIYPNIDQNFILTVIFMALSYLTMSLYPSFVQRLTLNHNFAQTTRAVTKTYWMMAGYKIIVIMIGLSAAILYPTLSANSVIPHMVNEVMPVGLKGLVIAALIAAVMSTADSDLNIASITLSKNVLKPLFNIKDDHKLLNMMRYVTILIGTLSIYIASQFSNILDLVIYVSGFWAPIFFVPFLAGVYDVTISQRNYVITCFLSTLSFFIWERALYKILPFNINGVIIGTLTSAICYYIFYKSSDHNSNNAR